MTVIIGHSYFYHPSTRIITRSNIRSPGNATLLLKARSYLAARASADALSLNTELVLEPCDLTNVPLVSMYYIVDHARQRVFWLEDESDREFGVAHISEFLYINKL